MYYEYFDALDKDISGYCSCAIASPRNFENISSPSKNYQYYKMTEASVDDVTTIIPELKIDSRLVVLIGSTEGIKTVSRKITSFQGVTRVRRGLFIIQGYSDTHDEILQLQSFASFSKTREIPSLREQEKDGQSYRVYSLVSFGFANPTVQQKKRVERLVRKTNGIRLRPGVILFPLLRSKEQRRIMGSEDERELLNSIEFTKLVRKIGGTTFRWSRLKIANLDGASQIRAAVERTITRDLTTMEEKILKLRGKLKDPSMTIRQLKKNYSLLSRSFQELRTKWMHAKKLWFFDAEKALKRTYNMLITTRRAIISVENERSR